MMSFLLLLLFVRTCLWYGIDSQRILYRFAAKREIESSGFILDGWVVDLLRYMLHGSPGEQILFVFRGIVKIQKDEANALFLLSVRIFQSIEQQRFYAGTKAIEG